MHNGQGYIAPLPEGVIREHVRFKNRYGLCLAGDIYYPENHDDGLSAVIVGAPYGGVKEQGPCVYAGELSRRGYVVMAFDQAHTGESGGEPRNLSSPDLFSESFMACVDYLGTKVGFVDRERIAVLGICGSGGFSLLAASMDVRIKAVITASLYDMTDVRGMNHLDSQGIYEMKKALSEKRYEDFLSDRPEYIPYFPEEPYKDLGSLPETDPVTNEWNRFYALPRGHHVRARGGFTTTSGLTMLVFDALAHIKEISPRPILFIAGDKAHSLSYSQRAYDLADDPKELYLVKGAEHIDLYDNVKLIPFDKIDLFLRQNLK